MNAITKARIQQTTLTTHFFAFHYQQIIKSSQRGKETEMNAGEILSKEACFPSLHRIPHNPKDRAKN